MWGEDWKMDKRARFDGASGTAALGICESLLLALTDRSLISEQDVCDLLTDVVTAHQEAAATSKTPSENEAVIAIVKRLLASRNGLRTAQ